MKKILFKLSIVFVVISLLAGLLAGCSGKKTTTATNALQQATIEIGVSSPLTGGAAAYGIAQAHGRAGHRQLLAGDPVRQPRRELRRSRSPGRLGHAPRPESGPES